MAVISRHFERAADLPRRLEAVHASVELGVREDGLDHGLALGVELFAAIGLQDAAHERVRAAVPARPGALAFAGVGWDEHLDAAFDDAVHLDLVSVARVGDDDLRRLRSDRRKLGLGRGDQRPEMPEVR